MDVEAILKSKGREVRTVAPDAAVAEALRRLRDERVGALVVSEGKTTVAGIVSDRGIMDALADRGAEVLGERVGNR
jgi:CBS domain-containing protein